MQIPLISHILCGLGSIGCGNAVKERKLKDLRGILFHRRMILWSTELGLQSRVVEGYITYAMYLLRFGGIDPENVAPVALVSRENHECTRLHLGSLRNLVIKYIHPASESTEIANIR
jgi:hypothetical protein